MPTDKPWTQVLVSLSGSKDSCLAQHEIQQSHEYKVAALLTTITEEYDRVSMHGAGVLGSMARTSSAAEALIGAC